jgi:predicted Abi (CAAX) family protease
VETTAVHAWSVIADAFRLRPQAFAAALGLSNGWALASAVVLLAGFSEAVGQSVVLFANRVKRGRFTFSLIVNAILFGFGYLFGVASTWAILRLPGLPHVHFSDLAIALALSYVPLLFAFLIALPYLGYGIGWVLRTWHLLAMVVAVMAVAGVDAFAAFAYVGIGWLGLSIAQQTVGRPIAALGDRILSAAAGVQVTSNEQLAVDRISAERTLTVVDGDATAATSSASLEVKASSNLGWWKVALGLGAMAAIAYVCAITLAPVHQALFGWQEHLPAVAQLPLNLVWIAIIGVLVAGFMAPVETLGWWAGWYGDAVKKVHADAKSVRDDVHVARYVVYLDGIAQSGDQYTSDIEEFLDALAPRLPKDVRLVRGVMAYSVLNRPLDEDPILSWFWRWIDARRAKNLQSLIGMFVNVRNILIVAVSADTRYGPIYNYGIGQMVYDALIASGYRANSGTPVTFIGYSGGGQMAAASATYVKRAIDAPVDVISLGGVMSGNARLLELEHLYHFFGEKDGVQAVGPVMFPSRWKIAVLSNWNRAARLGRLSIFSLGPVGHQIPGGLMDPNFELPGGASALDQTIERIDQVLTGRIEPAHPPVPIEQSNYGRYVAAAWNTPAAYPIDASVDPAHYEVAGAWVGRLVLPAPEQRSRVRGAWFEVHVAPTEHRALVGKTVYLSWADTKQVRDVLRSVTRDVHFSAQAEYSSRYEGLIQPVRVDHWQLVDPLESLAGSHPVDDVIVSLNGPVELEPGGPARVRIRRQPVQITGRYRAIVRFIGARDGDRFEVAHFNRETRRFDGPTEIIRAPLPVTDADGRVPSSLQNLRASPLNDAGFHIFGSPDSTGTFVAQAILPRGPFLLPTERSESKEDAYRYVHNRLWNEIVAHKGSAFAVQLGESDWRVGDRALVLHVFGGIGGSSGEKLASGPLYFGHFALGVAEVIHDTIADEPRFDIIYEQVYTHNGDGLIAGTLHMSRYLGDRQFGWAGLRPTANVLLKFDAVTSEFQPSRERRVCALDEIAMQLEAMTARYRIGDGTGATYVGPANNCAQDSGRALFGALQGLDRFVNSPAYADWSLEHPQDGARFARLLALAGDLRRKIQPFGSPRRDRSENEFNLGTTMTDNPIESVKISLESWRMLLPRLANDSIARVFFKNGATARVIATSQIGAGPDLEPVVPMTLPF